METSITVRTGSGSLYGNVLETVQPSGSEVYQMPVEVLGEIFKIYCCVEAESEDYVFDGIAAPALVLCQVCRTWRDVAEDLPSLWTDIRIDAGTMRETDLRALSAYLSLSRNRALKISVEYRTSLLSRAPNLVTEVLNDTFKALLTHSSRWKSLSMKNIFVQLHKVGSDQLYGFPMLEELRLPPNLEVASLDILNSSPKLHKLTLPSFSSLASVLCPLQGVTHLTIARSILTGEGEWQVHLGLFRNLQSLCLNYYDEDVPLGGNNGQIRALNRLRCLEIVIFRHETTFLEFPLFRCLKLPSLETFRVSRINLDPDIRPIGLSLERITPHLTSCSLGTLALQMHGCISCLELLQSLRSLPKLSHLEANNLSRKGILMFFQTFDLTHWLTCTSNAELCESCVAAGTFLPLLCHLKLDVTVEHSKSALTSFCNMLESRTARSESDQIVSVRGERVASLKLVEVGLGHTRSLKSRSPEVKRFRLLSKIPGVEFTMWWSGISSKLTETSSYRMAKTVIGPRGRISTSKS